MFDDSIFVDLLNFLSYCMQGYGYWLKCYQECKYMPSSIVLDDNYSDIWFVDFSDFELSVMEESGPPRNPYGEVFDASEYVIPHDVTV